MFSRRVLILCVSTHGRGGLTVDFTEREAVDDDPKVVEERQGDDHVPVVAELAGRVEHERPADAFDAVGRPVSVLPGTAVLLPSAVEADGTARVVVRRSAGRAAATARRPAAGAGVARRRRRRRRRRTGTVDAAAAAAAVCAVEVHPARTVLSGRRLGARFGRDVRIRAGYSARQTAARAVRVRRRQ